MGCVKLKQLLTVLSSWVGFLPSDWANFIDSHCQAFPLLVIVRGNAMENYTIPSHYKCLMKFSCAKCFQGLTTKRRCLHRYLCKCVRWSTQLQMQLLALMLLLKLPKFPTALFTLIIFRLKRWRILVCQQKLNWTWLFYFMVPELLVSSAYNILAKCFFQCSSYIADVND